MPVVPATTTPGAVKFSEVAVPPSRVPAVLVQVPENVCDNPLPRLSVPPVPLMVSPTPVTAPVKVATPLLFVMETVPEVVNPEMDWFTAPASVIPPVPLVSVPATVRLPPKVKRFAPWVKTALLLTVNGTLSVKTLASFRVIGPEPPIVIPPVALNVEGHSEETVLGMAPALY